MAPPLNSKKVANIDSNNSDWVYSLTLLLWWENFRITFWYWIDVCLRRVNNIFKEESKGWRKWLLIEKWFWGSILILCFCSVIVVYCPWKMWVACAFHFKKYIILRDFSAGNSMFKFNNRNTRTRYEIFWKLTIKTPERRHKTRFFLKMCWKVFISYCSYIIMNNVSGLGFHNLLFQMLPVDRQIFCKKYFLCLVFMFSVRWISA